MTNSCDLCGREVPEGEESMHHLIPKTFGGKREDGNMALLHQICHDTIHRTFTERELFHKHRTMDDIKGVDEIQRFIKWVAKKPNTFYEKSKDTRRRKSKRRR